MLRVKISRTDLCLAVKMWQKERRNFFKCLDCIVVLCGGISGLIKRSERESDTIHMCCKVVYVQ